MRGEALLYASGVLGSQQEFLESLVGSYIVDLDAGATTREVGVHLYRRGDSIRSFSPGGGMCRRQAQSFHGAGGGRGIGVNVHVIDPSLSLYGMGCLSRTGMAKTTTPTNQSGEPRRTLIGGP